MTELVVTGVSCCEWSMRVCAHNHKTFFRSHNGWMCLNHHWRDIRNWFSRWEKCTVMISNNSGIRPWKRLITLLEIVMIHISSMAMQITKYPVVYLFDQWNLHIRCVEDAFHIKAIKPPWSIFQEISSYWWKMINVYFWLSGTLEYVHYSAANYDYKSQLTFACRSFVPSFRLFSPLI